jgi:FPC/CPF motif-containing protein YcgG
MKTKKHWVSGNYVEFQMTAEQAQTVSHSGDCEDDARQVVSEIRKQLDGLDKESIKKELNEYGAWSAEELNDYEMNLVRLVWTLGGNLADELVMKGGK